MNNTNTINAADRIDLKGSKLYGEFYTDDKFDGFLYRLGTGGFAVVQKADYSGKIIGSRRVEGKTVERFRVLDLGYALVSMYRVKPV